MSERMDERNAIIGFIRQEADDAEEMYQGHLPNDLLARQLREIADQIKRGRQTAVRQIKRDEDIVEICAALNKTP